MKTVLITGGTRGIGAGIAKELKVKGYIVAANYNKGKEIADDFQKETDIETFSWDVSNYQACVDGIKLVEDKLESSIDILINNAGITKDGMFHKMSVENWNAVITTNLDSVFNMSRIIIDSMRNKNSGRIINISSVNGLKGQIGQVNYSAAKAAIIGFTKSLALESATKGITVNAIAPGYISTEMTEIIKDDIKDKIISTIPLGRFGQVDEIAKAILFLIDSPFITGSTINVNGGQYLQ